MNATAVRESTAAKKVLLAEDSLVQRLSLTGILEDQGYVVEPAQDGEEALRLLTGPRQGVDLVITDIGMPKMNGINLCRSIKKNALIKHIPVLMLTSFVDDRNQRSALEAGAVDFVTKPINEQELLIRVESILSNATVKDEGSKLNWHIELFQALPDAVIVTDALGRYIEVNPAATELFGHSRDDLMQMTDQTSPLHPPGWWESRRLKMGELDRWIGLTHFKHRSGPVLTLEAHMSRTQFDGDAVYIAVFRRTR